LGCNRFDGIAVSPRAIKDAEKKYSGELMNLTVAAVIVLFHSIHVTKA